MNNAIKKLPGGDFEVMAEDNVFIELAIKYKNEAIEQYKSDLVEWFKVEIELWRKQLQRDCQKHGLDKVISEARLEQTVKLLKHIEAGNEKV